ncbi:unnamed protein product [Rhizophagus irregularis]|nr:unnamed protein product [Rhizophagus irregularis]
MIPTAKVYDGILTLRVILATDLHGFTQLKPTNPLGSFSLGIERIGRFRYSNNFQHYIRILALGDSELEELEDSNIPIFSTLYTYIGIGRLGIGRIGRIGIFQYSNNFQHILVFIHTRIVENWNIPVASNLPMHITADDHTIHFTGEILTF